LPSRARLPLIAQIAGAFALIAAVTMPKWSDPVPAAPAAAAPVTPAADVPVAPVAADPVPARPAYLNLDLRHNFRSVDLAVTIDGKRALDTKLEGAGKKFGVFGRREKRSFARSLELEPGARVVRLRLKSTDDKFDHSRVERFDLGPASVASMRIDIEKAGLSVMAERPAAPKPAPDAAPPLAPAAASAPAATATTAVAAPVAGPTEASALAELYRTLRSTLIALAGFIASVASGFLFEEYLRSRNLSFFASGSSAASPQPFARPERRRRRRPRQESDISIDAGLS
jgi:hypothetical protein